MKKILSIILLFLTTVSIAVAEDVTFQASAPAQAVEGNMFRLTFSVNQRASEFRAPDFDGFEVLMGPSVSRGQETRIVNGNVSSSYHEEYTYALRAPKKGTYTIGSATITVDGKQYRSNGVKITVLPNDQPTQQNNNQAGYRQPHQASTSDHGEGEVFVRGIVSKTNVYEQECIHLTYKLYWRNMREHEIYPSNYDIPEYKGFLKQEIEQKGEAQMSMENYNGKNYNTAELANLLLFPQRTGDIEIEPATFEFVFEVENPYARTSFYPLPPTRVTKRATAAATKIHVNPLPAGKPAGFSGGVGKFSIKSSLVESNLIEHDAVNIKLTIDGKGNMKMLKTPEVKWPDEFEAYDPKVTNNFSVNASGMSGKKEVEYLAFAQVQGEYTIPAIEFSYFDPEAKQYKTLKTDEYTIHVSRSTADTKPSETHNFTQKEDIKQLGDDIHHIWTSDYKVKHNNLFGDFSGMWWLWFVAPLLLTILLFIIFRKRIQENSDLTRVRYKKANKVAQKRLRAAKKLLQSDDSNAFYEEIERAAWQYLSDRLSIPTSELTKDNIAGILAQKGVSEELIRNTKEVLSTAEFARYAPSAAGSKDSLYEATATLIDNLENTKL